MHLHLTLNWIVLIIARLKLLLLALHVKFFKSNTHNSVVITPDHGFIRHPTTDEAIHSNRIPSISLYYAFLCFILDCYVLGTFWIKYEIILLYLLSQMHILWQFSFFPFFLRRHTCDFQLLNRYLSLFASYMFPSWSITNLQKMAFEW